MDEKIKNTAKFKKFIHDNNSLFWWIRPEDKKDVSINALVEAVLNYGDEKDVKQLLDLIGIKTVADIFNKQISGKRSNYHKRTINYFKIYFERHAQ